MIPAPAELFESRAPDDRFRPRIVIPPHVSHSSTYPPLVHSQTGSLAGPVRLAYLSADSPYYGVTREESTVVSPDFIETFPSVGGQFEDTAHASTID